MSDASLKGEWRMLSRFWTWFFRSRTLQFPLIVLLIVLAVVFVAVPVSKSFEACILKSLGLEEDAKYEALKFLGISMGGVLVALQALMSHRRAKAMEDAVEKTEQGQRQDRLKNAIEHLGHESESVRLGGAYELFHLAKDTLDEDTKEKLSQTVLDILCAHIRQTTSKRKYREKHESKPSEEVQSLLTLMFVQEHEVFKDCHINLQESWLNGVNLAEACLKKAVLTEAHLQEALLRGAQLQGATLNTTNLQGATLDGAQLQEAFLPEARLQGADLAIADLRGAQSQITVSPEFSQRMRDLIGQESDLSGAIFEGGLSRKALDSLVEGFPDKEAKELREKLESHIGKPTSHQPPKNAILGAYTEEDAEKWIAEYEGAMPEV